MLKGPTTLDEQIKLLRDHNILISDEVKAKDILGRISYYRLTGYALQYRISPSNSDCIDGTSFDMIYSAYCFDEALRNILRSYLEIIEVFYKSQISYSFPLRKCILPPHDQHYDRNNYYNKSGFDSIISGFQSKGPNYYNDSLIMQHHKAKYQGKMPLWVMMELLSFSYASLLYSAMYISDQDAIANQVGVSRQTLANHLHCLSVLRNACAHCARLYGTELNPPASFNTGFLQRNPSVKSNSVFAYILILLRRLPDVSQKKQFMNHIVSLINEYHGKIDLCQIGFPNNYEKVLSNSIK